MGTILLVEDDADTVRTLSRILGTQHSVAAVNTGTDARLAIERLKPDLVLLDLSLPDTDGLLVAAAINREFGTTPVIICSGRTRQVDRVLGLKLGADDFVSKPFDLEELEARVDAVLRRAARHQELNAAPQDDIKVGRLCIAERRATVTFDGEVLHLTPTEYRILVVLAKRAGQVLSRSAIAREVWAYEDIGTSHLVDVHVGRLRLKLRRYQGSASLIVTVRGSGYRLGA